MSKRNDSINAILTTGILPLFYHPDTDSCIRLVRALYDGGARAIEFTNRGEAALKNFRALASMKKEGLQDLQLGIGTIKNRKDAEAFLEAGADFLVSPAWVPDVAELVKERDLFWLPGCMTPTEILNCEREGFDFVKLFPGNLLGPSYVEAVKPLFPTMRFIPTGGVDLEKDSFHSWFRSGVHAVGLGSKLINKAVLEQADYGHVVQTLTEKAIRIIKELRAGG